MRVGHIGHLALLHALIAEGAVRIATPEEEAAYTPPPIPVEIRLGDIRTCVAAYTAPDSSSHQRTQTTRTSTQQAQHVAKRKQGRRVLLNRLFKHM